MESLKSFAGRVYEINAFVVIFKSMRLRVYEKGNKRQRDNETTRLQNLTKPSNLLNAV